MKPEILLKAYVQYQSEDAFRDLVAGTLDEVYSTSLRMVQGAPHLAEEIVFTAYLELARKAPGLGDDIVLTPWLRARASKLAVRILRAEDRAIDWAAMKREKQGRSTTAGVQPAPPGLATCICRSVFLGATRHNGPGLFASRGWWPRWIRPVHAGGVAICVLAILVCWSIPFHWHSPIVRSEGLQLTPSSFAQLASPEEGGPPQPNQLANTNAGANLN